VTRSITLTCRGGSLELRIHPDLFEDMPRLVEEFVELLTGRRVRGGEVCVAARGDRPTGIAEKLEELVEADDPDAALRSVLGSLSEVRVGVWDGSECDTRRGRSLGLGFLNTGGYYDGIRAERLAEILGVLAERLYGRRDACGKCRAALLVLAYYAAAASRTAGCNVASLVWLGDVLRTIAGSKELLPLCPWEGDATAALYATLAYCSHCNGKREAVLRVAGDRTVLEVRAAVARG